MRKIFILLFVLAVLFIFTSCNKTETSKNWESSATSANTATSEPYEDDNVSVPDTHTFTGRVLSIEDGMILVQNFEENSAISPQVYVNISRFPELELKKGDKVRVVFNGQVAQSYPPQILGVISITKE